MARLPRHIDRFNVASDCLLFSARDLVTHAREEFIRSRQALQAAEALERQIAELVAEGGYAYAELEEAVG